MQLIGAPEVNQVLPEIPLLADLIHNLYDSKYDKFFIALGTFFMKVNIDAYTDTPNAATLEQTFLLPSRILAPHTRYYVREMRIIAYSQILESYRSLTLDSLARSFGVSIEFVDKCVFPSSVLCKVTDHLHIVSFRDSSRPADCTAPSTRCTGSSRLTDLR